ncbi:MAG: glycine zipper 2TM domain-containing protein [Betaproteobacteria bacterium]|nr:glycine zipper 2TM domain-containing protein [Betaproteobacteria bacterium]
MEAQATGNKLHPVLWIAAIAVILLSLAGVGAIFGVIPTAGSSSRPADPVAAAAPAAVPATQPATKAAEPVAEPKPATKTAEPAAEPKPAPARKVAAKPTEHKATEPKPAAAEPAQVAAQPAPPPAPAICMNCGTVDNIREITQKGEGTGVGAVGGAVVGGLLGNQIGKGTGKTVATVVGAAGGGYAGHQVEKHVRSTKKYEVTVRFEDGGTRNYTFDTPPSWRIGDRVKDDHGTLVTR